MRVIEPDADQFRMPPEEVVRLLRLLTFSGSHPHISETAPDEARRHRRRDPARHPGPRGGRLMLLRLLRTYLAPYRPG